MRTATALVGLLFLLPGVGCSSKLPGSFSSPDSDAAVIVFHTPEAGVSHDAGHSRASMDAAPLQLSAPDASAECVPTVTCASAAVSCGEVADGCGGFLPCGSCPTNQTCGGGGTPGECGTSCAPTTCAALGYDCGPAGDGCGGMLDCGSCTGTNTCGGGGEPSQCGTGDSCVPTSCAALGYSCGPAADGCGGMLDCGSCSSGKICGAVTPSQCGVPPCTARSCGEQGITCGPASDGCGKAIECGSCSLPTVCGGGGMPGVCGCTGTCGAEAQCGAATPTTLSGNVYDPADLHPIYNALVYVPNDPTDAALTSPFAAGITCDQCGGAAAAGNPLVSTTTAYDGSFTLTNVPVGAKIPLVIQMGRWRRQFVVDVSKPCGANSITTTTATPIKWQASAAPPLAASGHLTMPTSSQYGDIPRIGILSGSYDMVECELRKIGIDDSEFGDPTTWGDGPHVQFYRTGPDGTGAVIDSTTPPQSQLFGTDATTMKLNINQYDLVIAECEGYQTTESSTELLALATYLGAGGRLFASDFAYSWIYQNPLLEGSANWDGDHSGGGYSVTAAIDPAAMNPQAAAFSAWLGLVGVTSAATPTIAIDPAFPNAVSVTSPTQEWLHATTPASTTPTPVHFTFNTPIGAPSAEQCGRVTFSDWHTQDAVTSGGFAFPHECTQSGTSATMTAQETILEFMLFDATSCVTPYEASCTSMSCAQQGISCGPAGDGCGNLLQCGSCPSGETCGGGGDPGVCGGACKPTTCHAQGISCGPAGDGCGGALSCGTCPAGQTCGGGGTPGVCGGGTCTPRTCENQGITCGPAGDGCGNALDCGSCPTGQACGASGQPGTCGNACVPKTCGDLGFTCGPAGDGCGGELQCGTCSGPSTCGGGGTAGVCGSTMAK